MIDLSPLKKKKKITSGVIPSHGTIESFFKNNNSSSSSSSSSSINVEQSNIDTNSQMQPLPKKSNDDETKQNYAKCSICQVLLPKANLFIHQVRCYKESK
jgi:hypothetical protein